MPGQAARLRAGSQHKTVGCLPDSGCQQVVVCTQNTLRASTQQCVLRPQRCSCILELSHLCFARASLPCNLCHGCFSQPTTQHGIQAAQQCTDKYI